MMSRVGYYKNSEFSRAPDGKADVRLSTGRHDEIGITEIGSEPRNRPLLLQGTLTTFRRRCGKPTCRCAAGEPHESPALRFTEDGRTKTLTLTAAEVVQVTAALARYERARADLDAQAAEGITRLRGSRAARGSTGR